MYGPTFGNTPEVVAGEERLHAVYRMDEPLRMGWKRWIWLGSILLGADDGWAVAGPPAMGNF